MDNTLRSTMIGHADEEITDTIYTHVNDEQVSKAAIRTTHWRRTQRPGRQQVDRTPLVVREDNVDSNEKPLTPAAFVHRGAEI
jgi:hypothetical protein